MTLEEWQLWMHPYPTMIKQNGRRVNPSLYPFKRVYNDELVVLDLSKLFEERKRTTAQLKRCVRAIVDKDVDGKDRSDRTKMRMAISKAFAICTAQMQKSGYLRVNSQRPTKKGKKAGRSKAAQKGHMDKVSEYEKMLSVARGE